MKQGSADDPFAEEPDSGDDAIDEAEPTEETSAVEVSENPSTVDEERLTRRSLPYIHARDGVKDDRTQRPVFLRDDIEAGIDELVDRMEEEFGENVYKTDVTEAAMAVAQENPEIVADKLEEWGYGWA